MKETYHDGKKFRFLFKHKISFRFFIKLIGVYLLLNILFFTASGLFAQPTPPNPGPGLASNPPVKIVIVIPKSVVILATIIVVVVVVVVVIAGKVIVYKIVQYIKRKFFCFPKVIKFEAELSKKGAMVTKHKGKCYLSFGDPDPQSNDYGMKYYAKIELPYAHCKGQLMFVRNVMTHTEMEPGPNTGTMKECFSSKGTYVRDGANPTAVTTCRGKGPHEIHDNDTPRMTLNPSELVSRHDTFRQYLIWQPGTGLLRFFRFTVGYVQCSWLGSTTSTDPANADCTEVVSPTVTLGWKLVSHGKINSIWRRTRKRPVYTPTVKDLKWEQC